MRQLAWKKRAVGHYTATVPGTKFEAIRVQHGGNGLAGRKWVLYADGWTLDSVLDTLAEADERAVRAVQKKRVRDAVPCPVETCRAEVGRWCSGQALDGGRIPTAGVHPARREAFEASLPKSKTKA